MSQFGWFSYRALTHFLKAICPIYSPDMVMLHKKQYIFPSKRSIATRHDRVLGVALWQEATTQKATQPFDSVVKWSHVANE